MNKYFKNIYNKHPSQLRTLEHLPTPDSEMPQVSDSHRVLANQPFTKLDYHSTLIDLNKNKSQESDGLTPECYLAFNVLEEAFFESIMYSLEQ